MKFRDRLNAHLNYLKQTKVDLKQLIEQKCVYEVGSNMLAQALANKSVSRNEVEELKEIEK